VFPILFLQDLALENAALSKRLSVLAEERDAAAVGWKAQEVALRQRAECLTEELDQSRQELAIAAIAAQQARESHASRELEEDEVSRSSECLLLSLLTMTDLI
jgi:hypothetical protein